MPARERARLCPVPEDSAIAALLPGAHFHDAWMIRVADAEAGPLELFLAAARRTPAWIDGLMALRNRLARLVGLKDLGGFDPAVPRPADSYRPGDRVGVFTLLSVAPDEVLLGDDDRHLRVVMSLRRTALAEGGAVLVTTTVVHVRNRLGRFYMLLVRPLHRRIAPAFLERIGAPG